MLIKSTFTPKYIGVRRRRESPVPVTTVTAAVLAAYRMEEADLLKRGNREAKDVWMRLAHEESGLTQREIGRLMGHTDGATVSRRLSLFASRLLQDPNAVREYEALRAKITNRKA